MVRFLLFSVLLVAAAPASTRDAEYCWQWEQGLSREFSARFAVPQPAAWLPLGPVSMSGSGLWPVAMVPGMESAKRDSTGPANAAITSREGYRTGTVLVPPAESDGTGVTPALPPETRNLQAAAVPAYQAMGLSLHSSGGIEEALPRTSGGMVTWQFVVPWYGYLLISPGFTDPAWRDPLQGVPRLCWPAVPLTPSLPGHPATGEGEPLPVLQSPGFVIWLSAHQL